MIAEVMHAFPQMTRTEILWGMKMSEFFMWYDMALWKTYDYKIKWVGDSDETAEDINSRFVWDAENKRWK